MNAGRTEEGEGKGHYVRPLYMALLCGMAVACNTVEVKLENGDYFQSWSPCSVQLVERTVRIVLVSDLISAYLKHGIWD